MDIVAALDAMKNETRSRSLRLLIDATAQEINSGTPLWRSMDRLGVFSQHVISLVRVGEETGRLSENLSVIAIQEEKERDFRSKVRSAMTYPVLVMVLTVTVGTGIAWFILPRLATVFSQLQLKLPFVTRVLIGLGTFLGSYGLIAVPLFIVAILFLVWFVFLNPKTKRIGEVVVQVIPGVRQLSTEIELARSGYMLGNLLSAGVPIIEALESLSQATTSQSYQELYTKLRLSVEEGNSFRKSFAEHDPKGRLFPLSIQQMIVAGEQSGRLSDTLIKIGKTFEAKTDTSAKNLTVILEPTLLVIVWLGVVFVAVAVILPIYSLLGGLNQPSPSPTPPAVTEVNVNANVGQPVVQPLGETTTPQHVEQIPSPATGEPSAVLEQKLQIQPTSTGFVNVREAPSLSGKIINRVSPKTIHVYDDTSEGWYHIILENGTSGWVFGKYIVVLSVE